MQVNVEDVSSVKKVLHIEIPEEDVTRELEEAYNSLKKTAKVKGFRPGKVPRSVLEGLYKKQINADICSKLIQESFENAIKETNLKFLGTPQIDPPELEEKKIYKYDAVIEIHPEIGKIECKGLKLKKTIYPIKDEEIETHLKLLQKKVADLKKIEEERPVREGDFALIDYEGFKDGKPFPEIQKTENYTVKIGDTKVLKEFNEHLIGMSPGETKEIAVSFPSEYPDKKLADLEIMFHVVLKEIREEQLPEINDDFAKNFGKDSLNDLKDEIGKNLKEGYEKRTEQELSEQVFEAILAAKDFEVPDVMVNYELEHILSDAERSFAYHNMSMEQLGLTRENLSEKYRDTAVKQVKRYLILGKIIEQENLTLSDEDMEEGLKEMAETSQQPVSDIKDYYEQNPDKLEYFRHALLEKNAMKFVIENSEIEETEGEANQEPETSE